MPIYYHLLLCTFNGIRRNPLSVRADSVVVAPSSSFLSFAVVLLPSSFSLFFGIACSSPSLPLPPAFAPFSLPHPSPFLPECMAERGERAEGKKELPTKTAATQRRRNAQGRSSPLPPMGLTFAHIWMKALEEEKPPFSFISLIA